jgi:hypothetical protein
MVARILCFLLLPAMVCISAPMGSSTVLAADLDDLLQEGVITGTTADSITIADPQNQTSQTFVVNAATRITRNGKPVLLRSVQSGEVARITARKVNERRMAATIVVNTP